MTRKQEETACTANIPPPLVVSSAGAEHTRILAARLGRLLVAGDFVALVGPLGVGKTCFVQGLAAGMGIEANITSPTFIIMRYHPGRPALCHVDAYRIADADELHDIGIWDFADHCVVAVEWAERVRPLWPPDAIVVEMQFADDRRVISISGSGERWRQLAAELEQ